MSCLAAKHSRPRRDRVGSGPRCSLRLRPQPWVKRRTRSAAGTPAASASSSSATERTSASRWPQSTSRSSARRCSASSSTSASTPRLGGRQPGDHRPLERDRVRDPLGERGALLGLGADHRQPLRPAGRSPAPRARAAPAARAGSRSAPRTAPAARTPSQTGPAPMRPRRWSACGARPGCRTPAARPPARRGSASRSRGRPLAPSATGRHAPRVGAGPGDRPERVAAALEQPQRGQDPPKPRRAPSTPAADAARSWVDGQHREHVGLLAVAPHGIGGRVGQRVAAHQRQPVAERQLRRCERRARCPSSGAITVAHAAPLVQRAARARRRRSRTAPGRTRTRCARRTRTTGTRAARRRRARAARPGSVSRPAGAGTPRRRRAPASARAAGA